MSAYAPYIGIDGENDRSKLMLTDPAITDCDALPRLKCSKSWLKFKRKALYKGRMTGFSSLTASIGSKFSWLAANNLTGSNYNPTTNQGTILKSLPVTTQSANNTSGGGDEAFSFQQGITAGSSATLDFLAMTDLLQRANSVIARMKGYQFRLLSGVDDPTITPTPTTTSTGTVTNIGVAIPSPLDFQNGGTGLTLTLTVGGGAVTAVAIGAAGTGYPPSSAFIVVPVQAGGSGCIVGVITNGSGVPTSVVFITGAGGTGYTAATVPSTCAGQYLIYTGGFHVYADPSAAGFVLVDSTHKNVKLINNDSGHAVTFEIDVLGGST